MLSENLSTHRQSHSRFWSQKAALAICLFCFLLPAQAAPGDLDPTYGDGGKTALHIYTGQDVFNAVAIQPDGKIVAAGNTGVGLLVIARYNTNGTLDTSFDADGSRVINAGAFSICGDIAIQPDGKIVIVGKRGSGSSADFLVIRLTADGVPDPDFDGDGMLSTTVTNASDTARDVIIQPDGKILVVGGGGTNGIINSQAIALVRYNPNGSLDTSFDGDGKVLTDLGATAEEAYAVKLLPDGKILVLASQVGGENFLLLLRYLPNGSLDFDFDGDGISMTSTGTRFFQFGGLGIQSDGKIAVAVSIGLIFGVYDFTVFRYLSNGMPDTSFGTNGRTIIIGGTPNDAQGLVIQRNGKIVVAGRAQLPNGRLAVFVSRLNQDGFLDTSFGNGGIVYTQISASESDGAYDMALQTDGKIVVAGEASVVAPDIDPVILRYLGDPSGTAFDYDGDGKADVSVFRPSNGDWYISRSSNGSFSATNFGAPGDIIAPADFDGDGKTDIAVFRPGDGTWYRLNSSNNQFVAVQFGQSGDIPRPGDFDGDGKADMAVFRSSNGSWYRLNSGNGQTVSEQWGAPGDIPLSADIDGDGKLDLTVYRPSNQTWYSQRSSNNSFFAVQFGSQGDIPTPADYDGDGKTDVTVYRSTEGAWYRLNSSNGQFVAIQFGTNGDTPCAADYDGDGKADVGVYRGSSGIWYLNRSTQGFSAVQFGVPSDLPTPAAFNGSGL